METADLQGATRRREALIVEDNGKLLSTSRVQIWPLE